MRHLLILTLCTSACGESLRAFEDIQAGDIEFSFPDATTAVLQVDTTVDVGCEVHYGETDAFGRTAQDAGMGDTLDYFHTVHAPLLTGLEPDTRYVYRLQGEDAKGRRYESETLTFTTPIADARPGRNVATSATVVASSSEFSAAFAASHAIDGDPATEWSSQGDGDAAFIEIELTSPLDVVGVGFHTRQMADGSSITHSFTVTLDGATRHGPFEAGEGLHIGEFVDTAERVRFDVETSTGGNTGAREVEVYVTSG